MCTLTWRSTVEGYELFFNRDELRTRSAGTEPSEGAAEGVRYLAPGDPDAGGTWLAVNELGMTLALLNAHPNAAPATDPAVSRGLLVRRLASLRRPGAVESSLESGGLARFKPFTLLAVSPSSSARVFHWSGADLIERGLEDPGLLSSSSVAAEAAEIERRADLAERLERAGGSTSAHLEFHRSHRPDRGPLSACMHREDARTVSFCHVTVERATVALEYAPGPPCRTAISARSAIPRSRHTEPAESSGGLAGTPSS